MTPAEARAVAALPATLLGVFIFDATVTGVSPARVGLAVLFLNIAAAGLAWIARADTRLQPVCVLAEVVALSVLYLLIERQLPMAAGKSSR